ncbi:MAG: queuosine salvage family protein [Chloroflexota bacterium]
MLQHVRSACAEVARRARSVTVDQTAIAAYASSLPLDQARAPQFDTEHHFKGSPLDTAAFVLTLDAINFGSGYFPHLAKRPGMSGYFTIATSLKDHYERRGPIAPYQLVEVTPADCAAIFGQDAENEPAMELMALFARALNDLGHFTERRYRGRWQMLIESANGSAIALVDILRQMPFFNDVALYGGFAVPFYKRAQITATDLAIALPDDPLGQFRDLDQLTIFADNLVPHVLRVDGILRYEPDLAATIDSEQLLEPGSAREVEIRACGLHAVELMVKSLRDSGEQITAAGLDYVLWNRGQQPRYKAIPRHRARCVYY